jgi:hypothetical protein
MKEVKTDPNIEVLLNQKMNEIFATLNCHQWGKINSFDKTTQSAKVEIQVKAKKNETELIEYPVLLDVPVFFLQGGGAFIEFPVKKDDNCLILFNDRDLDNVWLTGNVKEPNSYRKHSLSDGIAIVGINPKSKVLSLDNDKVKLNGKDYEILITTTGQKNQLKTTNEVIGIDNTLLNLSNQISSAKKELEYLWDAIKSLNTNLSSWVSTNASVGAPVTPNPATVALFTVDIANATAKKTAVGSLFK